MTSEAQASPAEFGTALPEESLGTRIWENLKGGNLGILPVLLGLIIIVIYFAIKAPNFWSPVNFNNIIVQMAGTTMLAYGVVFVLLLGEIDLSIAYVSAVAGVVAAKLQQPDSGHFLGGIWPIVIALAFVALIGAVQGGFVAIIGVPSFVVTLAGLLVWQGFVQLNVGAAGPIIIENRWINYTASYFFSDTAGWIMAALVSFAYLLGLVVSVVGKRRHGVPIQYPALVILRAIVIPVAAFLVVSICNKDRGVPVAALEVIGFLIFWTFIAKRTTFGRHVYAVGGNAEAARRAGISVRRIRIVVFTISGFMAGVGGIILAGNLQSVAPDQGGGTLLLDAIAAAVIGGVSLFGGRGEVRAAVLGAAMITTIENGLFTLQYQPGVIFITTGCILLFAVTLDTIARRRQAKTGR